MWWTVWATLVFQPFKLFAFLALVGETLLENVLMGSRHSVTEIGIMLLIWAVNFSMCKYDLLISSFIVMYPAYIWHAVSCIYYSSALAYLEVYKSRLGLLNFIEKVHMLWDNIQSASVAWSLLFTCWQWSLYYDYRWQHSRCQLNAFTYSTHFYPPIFKKSLHTPR